MENEKSQGELELERRGSEFGFSRGSRSRRPSFFVEEGDQIIPLKIIGADNEEILPEDIAAAPDGGWGWVIVFSAFSISLIYGGVIFSFGVMLDAIVESSTERNGEGSVVTVTVSQIATVGACLISSSLFFGPFAAALVNKFGFRPVAITGSFVMSLGFAASWFFCRDGIPNIPALLLLNGVIGGIGLSLVSIPSIIIIGFWFEEKRALATGIALCGSGVGTCVFPPIMSALIAAFEWQGALLAQAVMLLTMSLFAMLYRPLDLTKNSLEKKVEEQLGALPQDAGQPDENIPLTSERPRGRITHQRSNCVSIAEESENGDVQNLDHENKPDDGKESQILKPESARPKFVRLHSLGNLGYPGAGGGPRRKSSVSAVGSGFAHPRRISLALPPPTYADSFDSDVEQTRILRVESKETFNKPMNRDDIFYRGSIHQIKEFPEDQMNHLNMVFANTQLGDIESSIPEEDQNLEESSNAKKLSLKEKLKQKLQVVLKMLNVGLMKSPMFIMLCLSCGFALVGLFVPFVYLIGITQEKGCTLDQATSLISIIGIADIFGRIIIGTVATKVGNHVVGISNAALTIGGVVTLLIPFCESYTIFMVYACVFGLANASISSLRSIIIVELLGLAKLTNAFGLTLFCEGIATLFGSPLMGFLKDTTGTYDVTFYTAGGFMLVAGLICYPIYNVKDWEENGKKSED